MGFRNAIGVRRRVKSDSEFRSYGLNCVGSREFSNFPRATAGASELRTPPAVQVAMLAANVWIVFVVRTCLDERRVLTQRRGMINVGVLILGSVI